MKEQTKDIEERFFQSACRDHHALVTLLLSGILNAAWRYSFTDNADQEWKAGDDGAFNIITTGSGIIIRLVLDACHDYKYPLIRSIDFEVCSIATFVNGEPERYSLQVHKGSLLNLAVLKDICEGFPTEFKASFKGFYS